MDNCSASNLLSPNSALEQVAVSSGSRLQQQQRRKSTLSANGFFVDYSCTRRRSSAAVQAREQQEALAKTQLLRAYVSPVRRSRFASEQVGGSGGNAANSWNQQRLLQQQQQQPAMGYKQRASYAALPGSSPLLLSSLRAPVALAGSRKTSIFDPTGHSITAPHLMSQRRKSTMVSGCGGGGPPTASQMAVVAQGGIGVDTMLSVARSAASKSGQPRRKGELAQHVPVIGCSPTSIRASLAALEETRRYEKLLRKLQRHQQLKEKKEREGEKKILRRFERLASKQHCYNNDNSNNNNNDDDQEFNDQDLEGGQMTKVATTTTGTVPRKSVTSLGAGLRRKSLRAIKDVTSRLKLSKQHPRRDTITSSTTDELSISSLSFGSSSCRSSLPSLASFNQQLNVELSNEDDDGREKFSYQSGKGRNEGLLFTLSGEQEKSGGRRYNNKSGGSSSSRGSKSLVRSAMRKLTSKMTISSSISSRLDDGTATLTPTTNGTSNFNSGSNNNHSYWYYYYYYLRENSMDLAMDDLPIGSAIGSALDESDRKARHHINYSLDRIEILNSNTDPVALLADRITQAAERSSATLAATTNATTTPATTANAEETTNMTSSPLSGLFDFSQSSDVSLSMSTSTNSQQSLEKDVEQDNNNNSQSYSSSISSISSSSSINSNRSFLCPSEQKRGRHKSDLEKGLRSSFSSQSMRIVRRKGSCSADDECTSTEMDTWRLNNLNSNARSAAESRTTNIKPTTGQQLEVATKLACSSQHKSSAGSNKRNGANENSLAFSRINKDKRAANFSQPTQEPEVEELDDFERFNRSHRGYKPPVESANQWESNTSSAKPPKEATLNEAKMVATKEEKRTVSRARRPFSGRNLALRASVNSAYGETLSSSSSAKLHHRKSSRTSLSWDLLTQFEPDERRQVEHTASNGSRSSQRSSFSVSNARKTLEPLDFRPQVAAQSRGDGLRPTRSLRDRSHSNHPANGLRHQQGLRLAEARDKQQQQHQQRFEQIRGEWSGGCCDQNDNYGLLSAGCGIVNSSRLPQQQSQLDGFQGENSIVQQGEPLLTTSYWPNCSHGMMISNDQLPANHQRVAQEMQTNNRQGFSLANNSNSNSNIQGSVLSSVNWEPSLSAPLASTSSYTFLSDRSSFSACQKEFPIDCPASNQRQAIHRLRPTSISLRVPKCRVQREERQFTGCHMDDLMDKQDMKRMTGEHQQQLSKMMMATTTTTRADNSSLGEPSSYNSASRQFEADSRVLELKDQEKDEAKLRARAHSAGTGTRSSLAAESFRVTSSSLSICGNDINQGNKLEQNSCSYSCLSSGKTFSEQETYSGVKIQRDKKKKIESETQRLCLDKNNDEEQIANLMGKNTFTCMLIGARQTGKRTIVKCFVKLLNEFKLAADEYRKEKLLTKLMDCSERIHELRSQQRELELQKEQQRNRRCSSMYLGANSGGFHSRARLNSWLGSSAVDRLLNFPSFSKRRLTSYVPNLVGSSPISVDASTNSHLDRRRHTTINTNEVQQPFGTTLTGGRHMEMESSTSSTSSCSARRLDVPKFSDRCSLNKSDTNINYNPSEKETEFIPLNQLEVPVPINAYASVTLTQQPPSHSRSATTRRSTQFMLPSSRENSQEEPNCREDLQLQTKRRSTRALSTISQIQDPSTLPLTLRDLNKRRFRIRFKSRRQLSERYFISPPPPQTNDYSETKGSGSRERANCVASCLPDSFMVVYSINDRESFEYARYLIKQLRSIRNDAPTPIILVANKVDLERAKVVKSEEGKILARKNSCKYIEISCTVGFNLDNLLVGLRSQLILKHHVILNSIIRYGKVVSRKGIGSGKEHSSGKSSGNENILVRFYKRYVVDNQEQCYDCDNFSKL